MARLALWGFGDAIWLTELDWSGCGNGFTRQRWCAHRFERLAGALNDKIAGATSCEYSEPLRAWALPAENRPV